MVDGAMHRYHCSCPACDFEDGYPFRVQTDSSCSGEVITKILSLLRSDEMTVLMMELQASAVDADAEPGPLSGFHVHANIKDLQRSGRVHEAWWNFLRWEQVLRTLSAGRFTEQRSNNIPIHRFAYTWLAEITPAGYREFRNELSYDRNLDAMRVEECWDEDEHGLSFVDMQRYMIESHYDADRHSNLNIATTHPTWEFRLWNSTRSAWRMEMFVRLSLAFVDPTLIDALRAPTPATEALVDVLGRHDERCAELVQRQARYDAFNAPRTLTLV